MYLSARQFLSLICSLYGQWNKSNPGQEHNWDAPKCPRDRLCSPLTESLVANTAAKLHAWRDSEADKRTTRGRDAAVKLHLDILWLRATQAIWKLSTPSALKLPISWIRLVRLLLLSCNKEKKKADKREEISPCCFLLVGFGFLVLRSFAFGFWVFWWAPFFFFFLEEELGFSGFIKQIQLQKSLFCVACAFLFDVLFFP